MTVQTLPDPVARARSLGPSIAAAADSIERTQRIPEPLLSQLHAARLCRMFLPRTVDGDEVEPWVCFRTIEELGRHDGSVAWNIFVASSSSLIAAWLDREALHAIFDDPLAWVAWGPANASTAAAVPGGYRITGEWGFASGSRQATWMGAHAQVVEQDGSLRRNEGGQPVTRTLLFPAAQAKRIPNWNTVGLRGTASEGYRLHDLFVPEKFSSTREEPETRRIPGRLYAFPQQTLYPVGAAGTAAGIARAMLDAFTALALRKAPRGLGRLADNAVVQSNVARLQARLDAACFYVVETLRDIWSRAEETGVVPIPDRARVRLACAHAIQEAVAVADYTYKTAGVDAIFIGSPFERRFRDMHTLSQQIQARDAHFEAVGRIMFGIMPDRPFW